VAAVAHLIQAQAHLMSLRSGTIGFMPEALHNSAPRSPTYSDEGILARVPGQFIAQASKSLPDPACALDDEMYVEIEAAWVGRVRLTFKKQRYSRPKGKISYVAWLCRHAEPVSDQSSQRAVARSVSWPRA
jgi:hypothetical protein